MRGAADRFQLDLGPGELGQAEIQDLHLATRRQKNIRRLDIAMDNALGVRRVERVCKLDGNVEQPVSGERARIKLAVETLSFQQFHRDERLRVLTLGFFDRVDGANVGMVQG